MPHYDPNRAIRWFLWGLGALGLAVEYTEAEASNKKTGAYKRMTLAQRKENFDNALRVGRPLAEELGVPMELLLAILSIESDFNPNSVNHTPRAAARGGAWGIGQVTFATAKDYAARFRDIGAKLWPKFNPSDPNTLLDLQTNLGFTLVFLKRALAKFGDDKLKAGVSYHQGSGNVQKAIDKQGDKWVNALMPLGRRYSQLLTERMPKFAALV